MRNEKFFEIALLVLGPPPELPAFEPGTPAFSNYMEWKGKWNQLMSQHGLDPHKPMKKVPYGHGIRILQRETLFKEYQDWWAEHEWEAKCKEVGITERVWRWRR